MKRRSFLSALVALPCLPLAAKAETPADVLVQGKAVYDPRPLVSANGCMVFDQVHGVVRISPAKVYLPGMIEEMNERHQELGAWLTE